MVADVYWLYRDNVLFLVGVDEMHRLYGHTVTRRDGCRTSGHFLHHAHLSFHPQAIILSRFPFAPFSHLPRDISSTSLSLNCCNICPPLSGAKCAGSRYMDRHK